MKFNTHKATALALLISSLPVMANGLTPIQGTFTNTTLSITNSFGDQYIVSSLVWGYFDGSTECNMTLTVPDTGTRPLVFAASSSCTNSLTYLDGDASLIWKRLGVLKFTVSNGGTLTNGYLIQTTTKPRQ